MPATPVARQSGVLLHPTSLPGPFGIGDLGPAAYRFVDFLEQSQQQLWQVLPLNPITEGNSPYTSPSAFAGNPLLLSLEALLEDGLLDQGTLHAAPRLSASHVEFGAVANHRNTAFRLAYDTFKTSRNAKLGAAFDAFRHQAASWLGDHALFMAWHAHHNQASWTSWGKGIRHREAAAIKEWRSQLSYEVEYQEFLQFLFARQWGALRKYANSKGVRIVGDIPIFVGFESADVWAHPHLFKLDGAGQRAVVAGVPPDYFAKDGQLWGNPLYNWQAMAKDNYAWWVERVRCMASQVDMMRVDHFRGFCAAWEVPANAKTAKGGRWEKGPGREVFDAIHKALGPVPFIAEDLGVITPDVEALRDGLGLPGMKILHFGFGTQEAAAHPYLPHNYVPNCVVYTGTHDNDVTRGWWQDLDARTRSHVQYYLARDGHDIAWDLMRAAWSSVAHTAIAPLQDVLDLGPGTRLNVPGKATGNWGWRVEAHQLNAQVAERLAGMTVLYGRTRTAKS